MTFDGRVATLQIRNFSSTRAGIYECIAKSDFGETRTSTQIVYEKSCEGAIGDQIVSSIASASELAAEQQKRDDEQRRRDEVRQRAEERRRVEAERVAEEERSAAERRRRTEEAQKRKSSPRGDQVVPEKKTPAVDTPAKPRARPPAAIKVPEVEDVSQLDIMTPLLTLHSSRYTH